MPFGLCNAPATFERLMSQVMRGLHWKRCLVYIDDILVFGHDFESALQSLELVLIRVAEYGLQLKVNKVQFVSVAAYHSWDISWGAQAWSVTLLKFLQWPTGFPLAQSKGCASSWVSPDTIADSSRITRRWRSLSYAYWARTANFSGQMHVRTLLWHCAHFSSRRQS